MKHLLTIVLILVCGLGSAARGEASRAPADPAGIQGLWVWQERWYAQPDQRAALLDFCDRHGFNRLLVQVHLDHANGRPAFRHPDGYRALVIDAAARGIAVEALDGAKDMAMRENWPRTLAILDAILAFNRTLPDDARLAGIHYDIEPYIMDAWEQSDAQRQAIMLDLLAYYDEAKKRLAEDGAGLTLAADIPFWYDNKTEPGDSCVVAYNGRTKNLHQHIQDICDYIGIMSYRRSATGDNGVVQVVQSEIDYAAEIGKVVTPALETIELKDVPQITFFGATPEEFWRVHNEVRAALGDHPGFGGMLTHSYRGARELFDSRR